MKDLWLNEVTGQLVLVEDDADIQFRCDTCSELDKCLEMFEVTMACEAGWHCLKPPNFQAVFGNMPS